MGIAAVDAPIDVDGFVRATYFYGCSYLQSTFAISVCAARRGPICIGQLCAAEQHAGTRQTVKFFLNSFRARVHEPTWPTLAPYASVHNDLEMPIVCHISWIVYFHRQSECEHK